MKRVCNKIIEMRGHLITVEAPQVKLGELAEIVFRDGRVSYGIVIKISTHRAVLQIYGSLRGLSTQDEVHFLGHGYRLSCSSSILGRCFNGSGHARDGGPAIVGSLLPVDRPSFNPMARESPNKMVRTNIPMIDVYNCLVRSQKIPIFSTAGEPHNVLLMRIAKQTNADVVVLGGMGLVFDEFQQFVDELSTSSALNKSVLFVHTPVDPVAECLLVPDLALLTAESFAFQGKHVLVLLTDMSAYADALKEIAISMDQIPSTRGYPGSLYSDLAARYERAIELSSGGSITLVTVTTMPGGDITHPIPDNTGYITEGQFFLKNGNIDPFSSLSRLKQLVIGHVTREDHGELANITVRLLASARQSKEKMAMGFDLSNWDQKLLRFAERFDRELLPLEVELSLEASLDLIWDILSSIFSSQETGIKPSLIEKFRPHWKENV